MYLNIYNSTDFIFQITAKILSNIYQKSSFSTQKNSMVTETPSVNLFKQPKPTNIAR